MTLATTAATGAEAVERKATPREQFEWEGAFQGDVGWDSFHPFANIHDFDWNLAVWWNAPLAEATRVRDMNKTMGYMWDPYDDLRTALSTHGGQELYTLAVSRLPRTEARCAEQLAAAVEHIVKANTDARPPEWVVYDAGKGIWRNEGEAGVNATVIDAVLRFGLALGRAVDAAAGMIDVVEPLPDQRDKPEVGRGGATQQDVDDWVTEEKRILSVREEMLELLKSAREMAKKIPRGKYATLRSELKTRVTAKATAWDSDTRWLVLKDGAVNVQDVAAGLGVTLLEFSPWHFSTMALDVAWKDEVRNAGTSEWEAGVVKVLPDAEVRRYLQKRFGAALLGTPGVAGKSMVWQFGPGDTAKSTLQECIAGDRGVFAPYSIVTSADSLTDRGAKTGQGERFKAYARGKRFVLMSELRDGEMLDQAIVKSVTGGETVEGTAKFQNAVRYYFTSTVFMASNHPPSFPPGDTALVGRIHVVPFEHRLWVRTKNPDEWEAAPPEHRADENWATRILDSAQERRAIFKWVLEGLDVFGREGLGKLPEAMVEAREEFATEADPIGRLVRTLLGTETDYIGPAVLKICTNQEWADALLFDGDGVTVNRVEQLINWRAHELGLVKLGETGLSPGWTRNAMRMLHELGGVRKKAMVDRDTRRTATVYTRIMELPTSVEVSRFAL